MLLKKVIVPLYINILYIIFKYIILYLFHWPRSEIKNLCKFFKATVRNAPHSLKYIKYMK